MQSVKTGERVVPAPVSFTDDAPAPIKTEVDSSDSILKDAEEKLANKADSFKPASKPIAPPLSTQTKKSVASSGTTSSTSKPKTAPKVSKPVQTAATTKVADEAKPSSIFRSTPSPIGSQTQTTKSTTKPSIGNTKSRSSSPSTSSQPVKSSGSSPSPKKLAPIFKKSPSTIVPQTIEVSTNSSAPAAPKKRRSLFGR